MAWWLEFTEVREEREKSGENVGRLFSKQQFIQDKECVIGITLLKSLSDADGNTGLDFDSPGAQCKPTPAYHPLRFRTFQT